MFAPIRSTATRMRLAQLALGLGLGACVLTACAAQPATPNESGKQQNQDAAVVEDDALPEAAEGGVEDENVGTVTLSISSGEHAGTYEGAGSLTCDEGGFVPDSWWITFAGGDDEDPARVYLVNLWLADPAHVDDDESPYRGDAYLADFWLGNPWTDGVAFTANEEEGGSVRLDHASAHEVSFSGTTSDGSDYAFTAECVEISH